MLIENPDIPESQFPRDILMALLCDHSSGRNIIWATDDYAANGENERTYGDMNRKQGYQVRTHLVLGAEMTPFCRKIANELNVSHTVVKMKEMR